MEERRKVARERIIEVVVLQRWLLACTREGHDHRRRAARRAGDGALDVVGGKPTRLGGGCRDGSAVGRIDFRSRAGDLPPLGRILHQRILVRPGRHRQPTGHQPTGAHETSHRRNRSGQTPTTRRCMTDARDHHGRCRRRHRQLQIAHRRDAFERLLRERAALRAAAGIEQAPELGAVAIRGLVAGLEVVAVDGHPSNFLCGRLLRSPGSALGKQTRRSVGDCRAKW